MARLPDIGQFTTDPTKTVAAQALSELELADIRGDLKWLKGGMAVNTAIGIAVMLKVFLH